MFLLTALWKRPELTALVLKHYSIIRNSLAESIDLNLLAVGSEGEVTKSVTEKYGFQYLEYPNSPLGAKWNAGLKAVKEFKPDAVVIIGSDDIVNAKLFNIYADCISNGIQFIGLKDMYFLDIESGFLGFWPGYSNQERKGDVLGFGRCLNHQLLDTVNWELWEPEIEYGLDRSMNTRLASYTREHRDFSTKVLGCQEDEIAAVDIKTDINIWSFKDVNAAAQMEPVSLTPFLDRYFGDSIGKELKSLVDVSTRSFRNRNREGGDAGGGIVSAAMIVKNEEKGIRAALESLRLVVDEIVIIDTGSTDKTIEIIKKIDSEWNQEQEGSLKGPPINLFHEEWRDDFSWARNFAQEKTSKECEWIVVLDGDEVLISGDLCQIIENEGSELDGITATVKCTAEGGREDMLSVRVYRKEKGRWEYPVHNQLMGVEKIVPSTAIVQTSYVGQMSNRLERSVPMLKKLYEDDKNDGHAPFYLSKMFGAATEWEQCLHWSEICHQICPDSVNYASFWTWYVKAKISLEGIDAATKVLDEALERHPDFPDLWHLSAAINIMKWIFKAGNPGKYLFAAQYSAAIFTEPERIKAGCEALKLPISINIRRENTTSSSE